MRDRPDPRALGWAGWLAVLLLAVTAVIAARAAVTLGRSLLGPGAGEAVSARKGPDESGDPLAGHVAQIDGRTMFFTPAAPPPQPVVSEAEPAEPRPDPAPTRYGGPAIVGMMFDSVWFSNAMTLEVGQSGGGVRVISMEAPWSARLEWRGVTFDVPFMQHDQVVLEGGGAPASDPERRASGEAEAEESQEPRERDGDRSQ